MPRLHQPPAQAGRSTVPISEQPILQERAGAPRTNAGETATGAAEEMNAQRAYALFEVKAVDAERRTFSGWATTPATDRVGDNINPLGAKFTNPLVLLHQHDHDKPI